LAGGIYHGNAAIASRCKDCRRIRQQRQDERDAIARKRATYTPEQHARVANQKTVTWIVTGVVFVLVWIAFGVGFHDAAAGFGGAFCTMMLPIVVVIAVLRTF